MRQLAAPVVHRLVPQFVDVRRDGRFWQKHYLDLVLQFSEHIFFVNGLGQLHGTDIRHSIPRGRAQHCPLFWYVHGHHGRSHSELAY